MPSPGQHGEVLWLTGLGKSNTDCRSAHALPMASFAAVSQCSTCAFPRSHHQHTDQNSIRSSAVLGVVCAPMRSVSCVNE